LLGLAEDSGVSAKVLLELAKEGGASAEAPLK